jgi:hypothetical protein
VHSAKLAGTEFENSLDMEAVAKGLYRLGVVFGQPYGSDRDALRQLAVEWLAALSDMPPKMFEQGISDWIATEKKWPRPTDLRDKAGPKMGAAIFKAASKANVNKARIQPTGAMRNYPFMRSKLRANDQWDAFLDTLHPTEEHNYFVEAVFGRSSRSIKVINEFRENYIREKFAERMLKHFGDHVTVSTSLSEDYDRIPHSDDGN